MSRTIAEIHKELSDIMLNISALENRKRLLNNELNSIRSKEFIRVNMVRYQEVEFEARTNFSFGDLYKFSEWLIKNSTKKYAVWNGEVYFTQDLKDKRFLSPRANVDDIPPA